jgi:hypothetical protein
MITTPDCIADITYWFSRSAGFLLNQKKPNEINANIKNT